MSGWFLAFNNIPPERIEKFRKAFTFPHLPPLQLNIRELSPGISLAFWNWRNDGHFHDIAIVEDNSGQQLLLEGYLTGAGKYGSLPADPEAAAATVLQLWTQHGEKVISELNGSFSLCIMNPERKEGLFITDRFNSRPVWHNTEDGTSAFANFATPLAALQKAGIRFDPVALWSLLCYSRPLDHRSLFAGIRFLDAGTRAEFNNGRLEKQEKWFNLHFEPDTKPSASEWAGAIVERLGVSTSEMIKTAPELYLFLSGGLDSRVAAGALGNQAQSITLASHINMNVKLSQQVAGAVGMPHEIFYRDDYDYLNYLDVAALLSNGNYNLAHAHFMKPCYKKVEEKPAAAFILGDLFENYNKHYYKVLPSDPKEVSPEQLPTIFRKLYGYTHPDFVQLRALFQPEVAGQLELSWEAALQEWAGQVQGVSNDHRDYLNALFRWYNNYCCPTNLMLECIKPFAPHRNLMFDNELFSLLLQMPAELKGKAIMHNKILGTQNKKLLNIADSNFWLPPSVPKPVKEMAQQIRPLLGKWRRSLNRKSKGGKPNFKSEGSWHMRHEWFKHDKTYQDLIEGLLEDETIFISEVFNREAVRQSWEEFKAGNKARNFEWDMLISYALVQRQFPASGIAF
ncbi:MAG: hypothetical protein WD077_02535 [Bacteroidia bacterium]